MINAEDQDSIEYMRLSVGELTTMVPSLRADKGAALAFWHCLGFGSKTPRSIYSSSQIFLRFFSDICGPMMEAPAIGTKNRGVSPGAGQEAMFPLNLTCIVLLFSAGGLGPAVAGPARGPRTRGWSSDIKGGSITLF